MDDGATVIAGVGLYGKDTPEENYIDGDPITGVYPFSDHYEGITFVINGKGRAMTWSQVADAVANIVTIAMQDKPAKIQIGYFDVPGLRGFENDKAELRYVEDATVGEDDTIWNVDLGPKAEWDKKLR